MARNKYPEITVNRILDVSLELFLKKGYDHTTIQDIVNALGDLTKGAIYHHFKSKDDIIEAVASRLLNGNMEAVLNGTGVEGRTGLEKIQNMMLGCLRDPNQTVLLRAAPNLMKNPRFLAGQIYSSVNEMSRYIIKPYIVEGIQDGSISGRIEEAQDMAEAFSVLTNIWINPTIFLFSKEDFRRKFYYLKRIAEELGCPFLTDEIYQEYERYRSLMQENGMIPESEDTFRPLLDHSE